MDKQAYTVKEFCRQYSISRALFYKLRRQGRGPSIIKVNQKTLITADAAQSWQASFAAK